jgi:hypothetical protein
MEGFFESSTEDSVKVAQDLVEKSKDDEVQRAWLESLAHRILQEMLLLETPALAATTSTPTTATTLLILLLLLAMTIRILSPRIDKSIPPSWESPPLKYFIISYTSQKFRRPPRKSGKHSLVSAFWAIEWPKPVRKSEKRECYTLHNRS